VVAFFMHRNGGTPMLAQLVNEKLIEKLKWHEFKQDQPHVGGGIYRMYDKNDRIIYAQDAFTTT
jgi:hypothetical protein